MSKVPQGRLLIALSLSLLVSHAHAGLQVPPVTGLPSVPTAPRLWFDGSNPTVILALQARQTNPRTSPSFNALKSFVDARLGSIVAADDDTRSKIVKAAGLLHVLGLTPPANQAFTSYRAVAVAAFIGVGSREAVDSVGEFISPPANAINILQDASRLQSLAEGFDFLRGAPDISEEQTKKMVSVLANWGEAMKNDWNLTGALGVPGHRDNWGIKGGSALVTLALALPENALASGWLTTGMDYLNGSLDVVASPTGWFGESVWYLNYSLANLWPTAWHAKNAAGKDWFGALEPFVRASFAWRQPDGMAPPFEEGISNTLPWNALASAYPSLAPQMLWAWDNSPKNVENFENQAMHDVTRFLLIDLQSVAAPPTTPVTRNLPNDAHLVALRSSWDKDALQVTSLTARDYSLSEAFATRHNMRNPLDLVLHGAGILAMPTASGGPQVTSSANRATYLAVAAKNIPLVNSQAPFVAAQSNVDLGDLLDSEDQGQYLNHYVDLARTTLGQVYAETREVTRVVAMVDRSYVVVLDRMASQASRNYQLSWRGRGARTTRSNTISLQAFSWAGVTNGSARLDLDVVATGSLTTVTNPSLYAPAWNAEESIDGVLVGTSANSAAFISVLQVTPQGDASRVVSTIAQNAAGNAVAAANIVSGKVKDTVLFKLGDGNASGDGVTCNGLATMVRREDGVVRAFAVTAATSLQVGAVRFGASAAVTLGLTAGVDSLVFELSPELEGTVQIELEAIPGLNPNITYRARKNGVLLTSGLSQSGARLTLAGIGAGTYTIEPSECSAGSGPDPDRDLICGSADNCPTVFNANQLDSDNDGIGDLCECLDGVARCDDGSACTVDTCATTTGACSHAPVAGTPSCDDGSACTSNDVCTGGACVGATRSCDDGNACTSDSCAAATGCINTPRNGQACDDGDQCTSDDSCVGSVCGGTAVTCNDQKPCTVDVCQPAVGCVFSNVAQLACNDGDACTRDDVCVGATCRGVAVTCDDDNPCTDDSCDPTRGCVTTLASPGLGCDDQDRCTRDDFCGSGQCAGLAIDCDDGNPCTDDSCDALLGCRHTAGSEGLLCSDQNSCTTGDVCVIGQCLGAGLQCDDGNPCTVDTCALGSGCAHVAAAVGDPCDDGDPCSDGDVCDGAVCAGTAVECDDGDPCTTDLCDSDEGACVSQPIVCDAGSACEDGECSVVSPETEPDAAPEASPEAGPEATEIGPEIGPDATEATEVSEDMPEDAEPELTPEREPDADLDTSVADVLDIGIGSDGEGLDFSDVGSQVIGNNGDDGCGAGRRANLGVLAGIAALLVGRARAKRMALRK